ncbi:MAG: amidohydrolase family protein [Candidatus Freyarchaeota archaeon]|nr:hypothetical protein [Candidatus Bathyarchaeota archaeon]
MSGIILKNGFVFDPLNGIEGEKMDIMIKDGFIVDQVDERESKVLDVKGKMVVPGGIDCHTHLAAQTLSFAKMINLKVPLPRETGEVYLKNGYTFIVESGTFFSRALHTHLWLQEAHSLDKACLLLLDSNWFLLTLAQQGDVKAAADTIAWLLRTTKTYGIKLVNPLSAEAWTWKREWKGMEEKIRHLGVSPLEYAEFILKASQILNLPSPLHIHPDGALQKGGYEKAVRTLEKLREVGKVHLAHAQLYTFGEEEEKAEELAKYINSASNIEAEIGQTTLTGKIMTSSDPYLAYAHLGRLSFLDQIEIEGVSTLIKVGEKLGELWAVGLKLLLNVKDLSKVQLTVNHPNCGLASDYPLVAAWLVSKKAREKMDKNGQLSQLDQELTLQELFMVTRCSPAAALGLNGKGNLSRGAEADVAVYDFNPESTDPSKDYEALVKALSKTAYTIKGGEIIVKNGEVMRSTAGKTLWAKREGEPPDDVFALMERFYSFDLELSEMEKVLKVALSSV